MAHCNNICEKYRHKKNGSFGTRYSDGAKRCQSCEIYIIWMGINCPCCGTKLRIVSHNPGERNFKYPRARQLIAA